MAEHDRQRHLRLLEPVGHVEVAPVGIEQGHVVANDLEHPEGVGRSAHVAADLGVAILQERHEASDVGAKVGLAEGAALDEAQHHDAGLDMDDFRRQARLEGRHEAARSRSRKT